MSTLVKQRAGRTSPSIGTQLTARRVAELSGLRFHKVVQLCRSGEVFAMRIRGAWFLSEAIVPGLRVLAQQQRAGEVYIEGGITL